MSGAWRYVTLPHTPAYVPLSCQTCGGTAGTVAVYEGLVWRQTLCEACAAAHRAVHGEQLELFGEDVPGDESPV